MSNKQNIKEDVYNLYVQHEIIKGLEDMKEGNTYTSEELIRIINEI